MTQLKGRLFRYLIGVPAVLAFAAVSPATPVDDAPDSSSTAKVTTAQSSGSSPEVQELKRQLADQQKQIEELRMILLGQKKQIETVTNSPAAPTLPASSDPVKRGIGEVASATPILPPAPVPASLVPPLPQAAAKADESNPLQLKIGDTTIIPIAFMDLTNTYRSTNAGSSLQTNFGSIPYNNVLAGRLTEDKFSAANSRIGFRVDTMAKGIHVLGYYEGDFVGGIGNGAFNTQVSSNSLLYRIRLYWVDLRKEKWELLAGQSWSMMTPNRKQISALPGDLFYSQVVDVNYMNGLTWGRIPGMRVLYHPSEKVTLGLSLENSTQYLGGSGGGGIPTLPTALVSTIAGELDQNVANGVATPNVHPDIIAKVAFDPSSHVHFEMTGMETTTKLFNPGTQQYFTKAGGGVELNGNFELLPGLRLVTNNYWSDGGGRYLFGLAPNFIVRSDGSPSLVHSGSTVSGFEYAHKNSQFYTYYGGVYIGRNTAVDAGATTAKIGYGWSGSPNSQNKTTQEGTFGWTQTLFRDAKYGAVQAMFQYAYFFRNPWYVGPGQPKNTHENAVWFNLRYTLPGAAPSIKY